VAILTGEAAKDEIPIVVLDAITVFDDAYQGVRVEIQHADSYWYVREEDNGWHLAATEEAYGRQKLRCGHCQGHRLRFL
jgi:hypothetical protein